MADQDDKKQQALEELSAGAVSEQKVQEEPVELSKDSQNLLKEFDQANLEVADMPESNELQERRRKTKNRLRELSEVGDPEVHEGGGQAFENEEGGLMDLLKEANLSKRQVGFCCGGVLVVFLLVGLIYGGIKVWNSWPASAPDEVIPQETTTTPPPEDTSVSSTPDTSLTAGIMVGQSTAADSTTGLGEDIGSTSQNEDELTQLIADFSKMYEAMQVDVNQLLDQSTDRNKALADYEQQLNYLLYLGKQNEQKLIDESSALVAQYQNIEDQKATQETRFFDRLRNLDAFASTAALNSFVADGQEVVKLRAHYMARQKLLAYYQQVLESLSARIADVQLNEHALIEGVKVVDIQGSDINLIIDESQL
jgi:hypothetical protein